MKYLQGIVGSMVSTMAVDPEKAILATILTVVGGGLIFIVRNRESVKGLFSYGRNKGKSRFLWMHKAMLIAFMDGLIVLSSYFMALLMRFDFIFSQIPQEYIAGYLWSMPFWITSTIVVFYVFRLYHSVWRLASISELQMCISAYAALIIVYGLGILFMQLRMPRSYYFMGYILCFLLTTGLRFSYRMLRYYAGQREQGDYLDRIMVIGAGNAGQALIRELINNRRMNVKICCVIDDNPNKLGRVL